MPQNKKPQERYGIKHAAFSAVAKQLKGREHLFTQKEIFQLIEIAASPMFFSMVSGTSHIRAFGNLYGREPSAVIEILGIARAELDNQCLNQAGIVRHFLLTHATIVWKGKQRAVSDLTDGEVAECLTRPGQNITAESVRTERKNLRAKGSK